MSVTVYATVGVGVGVGDGVCGVCCAGAAAMATSSTSERAATLNRLMCGANEHSGRRRALVGDRRVFQCRDREPKAAGQGFEPRFHDPESRVLPLDDPAQSCPILTNVLLPAGQVRKHGSRAFGQELLSLACDALDDLASGLDAVDEASVLADQQRAVVHIALLTGAADAGVDFGTPTTDLLVTADELLDHSRPQRPGKRAGPHLRGGGVGDLGQDRVVTVAVADRFFVGLRKWCLGRDRKSVV